jgi:hypothetical protein
MVLNSAKLLCSPRRNWEVVLLAKPGGHPKHICRQVSMVFSFGVVGTLGTGSSEIWGPSCTLITAWLPHHKSQPSDYRSSAARSVLCSTQLLVFQALSWSLTPLHGSLDYRGCRPGWVRTWRKIPFDRLILQCRIRQGHSDLRACSQARESRRGCMLPESIMHTYRLMF